MGETTELGKVLKEIIEVEMNIRVLVELQDRMLEMGIIDSEEYNEDKRFYILQLERIKRLKERVLLLIHEVCRICKNDCKQPYSWWSWQMPPQEYCSKFIEKKRERG